MARASAAASTLRLLDVSGIAPGSLPPAIVAGESVTLRLLLPSDARLEDIHPGLFQSANDAIQVPLRAIATLASDPADPRVVLARFVAPLLTRPASIELDLGASGSIPLVVFPADIPRADQVSLAETLASSRLRLAVAGRSSELRAYLRAEKIDFADLGTTAPERLEAGVLLLAELTPDAWLRLAAPSPPAGARLLAFLAEPALLPGVYAEPAGRHAKITLPLLPRLAADPRARATLHALLLQTLSPSPEPSVPSTR